MSNLGVWNATVDSFTSRLQSVASRATNLRVAVVCYCNYLSLQNAVSENKFSPLHFLKPTIYDCNSHTSVTSQLLRPFESSCVLGV